MQCKPELEKFGLIIIGDEILSGKRQDKHLAKVIDILGTRGLVLSWAHYLPDDRSDIAKFLSESLKRSDIVFSTGGIGGTPDDHTRQAAAQAAGVEIVRHGRAVESIVERANLIAAQMGLPTPVDMHLPENAQRLTMADFPHGCELVPNPYNGIAGFSLGRHYFVPGFPVMAWPMIEWVLDTCYQHLHHPVQRCEQSLILYDLFEAQITPLMEAIEREFPDVKVFSLPSVDDAQYGRHIEVGVKGSLVSVPAAYDRLRVSLLAQGGRVGSEFSR
jgi:molybdopterin-biosynthesis enzyme MoeA-like protein